MYECRFCNSKTLKESVFVNEMMYGTEKSFKYDICKTCESIQIREIPGDLENYYRTDYAPHTRSFDLKSKLNIYIAKASTWRYPYLHAFIKTLLGSDLILDMFVSRKIKVNSRILDVGCGSGALLMALSKMGYKSLSGIDPFLPGENLESDHIRLEKMSIDKVVGRYDVIIVNHVFEHTPSPIHTLEHIRKLLSPDGIALILTPIANCYAWRTYREHWVQIDAPRHLNIPSVSAFATSCSRVGLTIEATVFNSTDFQILASRDYKNGIPLTSRRSIYGGGIANKFRLIWNRMIASRLIRRLNLLNDGDQAAFVLRLKRTNTE